MKYKIVKIKYWYGKMGYSEGPNTVNGIKLAFQNIETGNSKPKYLHQYLLQSYILQELFGW